MNVERAKGNKWPSLICSHQPVQEPAFLTAKVKTQQRSSQNNTHTHTAVHFYACSACANHSHLTSSIVVCVCRHVCSQRFRQNKKKSPPKPRPQTTPAYINTRRDWQVLYVVLIRCFPGILHGDLWGRENVRRASPNVTQHTLHFSALLPFQIWSVRRCYDVTRWYRRARAFERVIVSVVTCTSDAHDAKYKIKKSDNKLIKTLLFDIWLFSVWDVYI